MRHALAALLFATPLCAFAAPALAQTAQGSGYGPAGPVGAAIMAPFNATGAVLSAPFGGTTVASSTGAPAYRYHTMPPPIGHCDMIAGNHICFATP